MPPFGLVDGEPLGFHGLPEQIAQPASFRRTALISGKRTVRKFVVFTWHRDFPTSLQIIEGEVDGTTSIVTRTPLGIRHALDFPIVFGCRIPKGFGDGSWPIPIKNHQPIAFWCEFLARSN